MESTTLVTGGAGFIGSHICERLLKERHKVICLDNFDPYYDPHLKRRNLCACLKNPNFKLLERDVRDKEGLERLFRSNGIDKIVHLSARPGVRRSVEDPFIYEDINVRGTLNLLELSRKYGIKNFAFTSSSSVYGICNKFPFSEEDPTSPTSPYAASKRAAEIYCETYASLHRMSIVCLRLFTVYDPRQRPDMAIHKFTRLIDQGGEVPVFGDGSSKRDYTYVDDVVDGVVRALISNFSLEIFNIGTSSPVELMHVISLIEKELGKKAKIRHLPPQLGDVPITHADVTKAERMLGYKPKVPIEEGIKKFIRWYKETKLDCLRQ